jgi:hypothetical protein
MDHLLETAAEISERRIAPLVSIQLSMTFRFRRTNQPNKKGTTMNKVKLLTASIVASLAIGASVLAAEPSPDSGKKMSMQEMMKDKDMMHQMCADMCKDPEMVKMMCQEMMKNPDSMKTMCNEMMKNDKAKAMCMGMMDKNEKK